MPDGKSPRVAILVARFNSMITEQLLQGARAHLEGAGIAKETTTIIYVPGSWELPQSARRLVDSGAYDVIIAIGCVIRGETAHFDYVAGQASDGLGWVALTSPIPIIFGVLTTDNAEQALTRADLAGANKGAEFAHAALEMLNFPEPPSA